MTTPQEIFAAAQSLTSTQRAELIYALWETVATDDLPPPTDDWLAEVQRRSEAYDEGRMTAAPWSEVRARVRREAGLDD